MRGQRITPEMVVDEVVDRYPETIPVFIKYQMQCVGCHVARFETIGGGAAIYGIDLDELIGELNAAVNRSLQDEHYARHEDQ